MTARIIDGKAIAAELRARVADEVARVKREHGLTPGLAVVLVGNDPASEVYVRSKHTQTQAAGMASFEHKLPADVAQADLLALIAKLNRDPAVHGILVQLPLPKSIAHRNHHQRHRSRQGRRRAASEQCRAARRRLCGAVALHAARLHHPDQERACLARGHERDRHRPLQPGRPSAGAIAAQRERHGDDRAFALARSGATLRPRRSGLCRGRQAGDGARRLDQAGRHRDRCRHQPASRRPTARRAWSATSPIRKRSRSPARSRRCPAASGR